VQGQRLDSDRRDLFALLFSDQNSRITIEPWKRSGHPCIRGLRITVWDVLSWLAAGMSEREILDDYPELERNDFPAIYDFAAHMGRRVAL
jgi:uncharacterized protein (DUF433 family)